MPRTVKQARAAVLEAAATGNLRAVEMALRQYTAALRRMLFNEPSDR